MLWGRWIGLPWYWHHPYLSSSFLVVQELEYIGSCILIGWLVVRLHRQHGMTMLVAYRLLALAAWPAVFLSVETLMPRLTPPPYWLLPKVRESLILSLWMLFGGYWATRRPEAA